MYFLLNFENIYMKKNKIGNSQKIVNKDLVIEWENEKTKSKKQKTTMERPRLPLTKVKAKQVLICRY